MGMFRSQDDINRIEALTAQVDGLSAQLGLTQLELENTKDTLQIAGRAGAIAAAAFPGNIPDIATGIAARKLGQEAFTSEVTEDELARYRESLERDRPGILAELEGSGALERRRRQTRGRIRRQVLAEEAASMAAAVDTPELRNEIRAELEADGTMATLRENARNRRKQELLPDVTAEVTAELRREADNDETVKAEAKAEFRASPRGQQAEKDAKNRARQQADKLAPAEVAKETEDAELARLLRERAGLERTKAEKELRAAKLLEQFTGSGIQLGEIEAGNTLVIRLGDANSSIKTRRVGYDYPYRDEEYTFTEVICSRTLSLVAVGDVRFRVDHDSLLDLNTDTLPEPYARLIRNDAIQSGTLIAIGMLVSDNSEQRLEPTIRAGVILYYDERTDVEGAKSTEAKVANVELNGVSARHVDNLRMTSPADGRR